LQFLEQKGIVSADLLADDKIIGSTEKYVAADDSIAMDVRFSFEEQTERLITAGRVILASFSLVAIWLDPTTPSRYASVAYPLLIAYVLYAMVLTLVVWRSHGPFIRLRLFTHVFDLVIFSLFIYFIEGPTSPFFVYFVFAIVCGTLRWQWRGTLWTAVVALATFLAIGFLAGEFMHDPAFEVDRFIIRSVYLAVVAALLGYLGAYESQRRGQLAQLAAWSRTPILALEKVVNQTVEQAQAILKAPRLLWVWDESDEPWLHTVMFSEGRLQWSRHPPETFQALVDASLEGHSFFSQDVRSSSAIIVDGSSYQTRRWHGAPLSAALVKHFDITSVLAVNVSGENLQGRFFLLDKSSFTTDDVILANVVAGQAAASMDLFYFLQRLQQLAARDERMRLAHDLHDGVLQSLTATGLQLQAALQVLDANPHAVREQLQRIQHLIFEEQRDLRSFVEELKLATLASSGTEFKLDQVIEELAHRIEREWGLQVNVDVNGSDMQVSAGMAREIYQVVREGLVNAARHSRASAAHVVLNLTDRQVQISVSDNGIGFPFRGQYDQAALTKMGAGPAMLRSRISSLDGSLTIHSGESGARLEITLPLSPIEN
jgi:signal transduction histidine kinase